MYGVVVFCLKRGAFLAVEGGEVHLLCASKVTIRVKGTPGWFQNGVLCVELRTALIFLPEACRSRFQTPNRRPSRLSFGLVLPCFSSPLDCFRWRSLHYHRTHEERQAMRGRFDRRSLAGEHQICGLEAEGGGVHCSAFQPVPYVSTSHALWPESSTLSYPESRTLDQVVVCLSPFQGSFLSSVRWVNLSHHGIAAEPPRNAWKTRAPSTLAHYAHTFGDR